MTVREGERKGRRKEGLEEVENVKRGRKERKKEGRIGRGRERL